MAKVYRVDHSFDRSFFDRVACAFGVFDGVHRGHQFLLEQTCEVARNNGSVSVALTFDKDPDEIFRPSMLKKLMTNEARIDALAQSGVDVVAVLPFTREFASQNPVDFLTSTFGGYAPHSLHVGHDFRFGYKACGSVEDLCRWSKETQTLICAYDLAYEGDKPITATRIRSLLQEGKCEQALDLLGHSYTYEGRVEEGRHEGTSMGFATANLTLDAQFQTLGEGVYAAWVMVDGVRYKAAMSVGTAPTFDNAVATCEAHILDFSGDIYGETILVEPVHLLRPMIKFETVEQLIETVTGNIEWVRQNL